MAESRRKGRPAGDGKGKGRRKPAEDIRRPPGSGSFHDTRTGVRFRCIIGRTASGEAITHDFYGRTEEAAIAKSKEWIAANNQAPPSSDAAQTLEAYLLTWLAVEVQPHRAVSTWESYTETITNHVLPHLGATRMCDLETLQLQTWVNQLGARRTTKYAYVILKAALATAIRWKIISENPADGITLPRYKVRKAQALTLAQAKALLLAAAGRLDVRKPMMRKNGRPFPLPPVSTRYALLYMLYVALGTRRGELLALRWSDLNLDLGTIMIERSLDKHRRERETKSDSSNRLLYLEPVLVEALRAHRILMQAEAHEEGRKPDGLVFCTALGTAIGSASLLRHFKTVLEAAGLPETIRIHDLRHTSASLMLARGGLLADVSKALGHSSTTITGKVYAHAYEEGKRKALASVARALGEDEE